jgi:hypothetical protein
VAGSIIDEKNCFKMNPPKYLDARFQIVLQYGYHHLFIAEDKFPWTSSTKILFPFDSLALLKVPDEYDESNIIKPFCDCATSGIAKTYPDSKTGILVRKNEAFKPDYRARKKAALKHELQESLDDMRSSMHPDTDDDLPKAKDPFGKFGSCIPGLGDKVGERELSYYINATNFSRTYNPKIAWGRYVPNDMAIQISLIAQFKSIFGFDPIILCKQVGVIPYLSISGVAICATVVDSNFQITPCGPQLVKLASGSCSSSKDVFLANPNNPPDWSDSSF